MVEYFLSMGAKIGTRISGEVYVSTLEGGDGWRVTDPRTNWMGWGLPIDEADLPEGYGGGRWAIYADKYDYNFHPRIVIRK